MGNRFGSRLLGELCHEITVGFVGSMTNEYIEDGIPFLRSKNVDEYDVKWDDMKYVSSEFHKKLSKSALKPGDVAIVRTGKPGTTCVIPNSLDEANCSDLVIARVNNELLCPHYLSYFMNAMAHGQVNAHVVGAVQQHFNVGSAKKLEIPLPSRSIQAKIVQVLKTLDDKLKLNSQINQTLEQMAQALFKSWFVDFDPAVDNALDAGFFEQNLEFSDELLRRAEARKFVRESSDFKSLPDDIRQHFPASFEECTDPSFGLGGWVPEGWKPLPVSSLIDLKGGGTPKTSEDSYWGGNIPWFSVVDAPNDSDVFVIDTEKKITNLGVENSSTKILRKGTTIISARGTVGKCAVVATPMAMNQSCYGIVGVDGIHDYFIYYLIRQSVSQLQQRSHGSVFSTITRDTFKTFNFAFSGEQLANEFGKTIFPWFEKIISNNRQKNALENLRDTLLPKLISGELRLDNIEAKLAIEAVT